MITSAQSFPLEEIETHLANQEYETSCQLIDQFIADSSDDSSTLVLYYQGKSYSQLYFHRAAALDAEDNETYRSLAPLLDKALLAFAKAIEKEDSEYREQCFRQLKGMSLFMKEVSTRYYQMENLERFSLNVKNARRCSRLVKNKEPKLEVCQLDTELIFLEICAAETLGKREEAKQLFLELKETGITEEDMFIGIGQMYDELEAEQKAIAITRKGREKYPNSALLLYQELDLLLETEQYDQVLSTSDHAIKSFEPETAQLYFIKGNACDRAYYNLLNQEAPEAENYYDQAEIAYLKAVELAPKTFDYAFNLAALYYNKALLISKKSPQLAQSPNDYLLLFTKAEEALQNTLALDNSQQKVLLALADMYKRTKQNKKLLDLNITKG